MTLASPEVVAMPLEEFGEAGLVVAVRCQLFGETVVFASDNAPVDPGERRVVYGAAELQDLLGLGPEDLHTIHQFKKLFGGTARRC